MCSTRGEKPRRISLRQCFPCSARSAASQPPVDGFGDKAIFYYDKSGLEMLNILKGNVLITIGMHGVPAKTVLEQEKLLAKKILPKL